MTNDPMIIDAEARLAISLLQPKILYAGDSWGEQPYTAIQEDSINIVAGPTNSIAMSDKFGTTLGGVLSFLAMPDQISIGGGFWTLNPLLLSCLPSTTPTPISVLVKATPKLLAGKNEVIGAVAGLISNSDAAR